jgi:hypothetical protein
MWNTKNKMFGDVGENVELSYTFEYTGDKNIISVSPDCGCSTAESTFNSVTLNYTTFGLPANMDEMAFSKGVSVTLSDNTTDHLLISGVVKRI